MIVAWYITLRLRQRHPARMFLKSIFFVAMPVIKLTSILSLAELFLTKIRHQSFLNFPYLSSNPIAINTLKGSSWIDDLRGYAFS